MAKKNMIAMILAGGRGSRLGTLTKSVAKPAVPFGSRYRIIDFALSNVANSEIDTVGVLSQYEPLELNTYVGNGHPWDLDRTNGGAFILPPYENVESSDWYTNTANAVYQNIGFIDKFEPEYVLILSGDHIYKMNYAKMLQFHLDNEADGTIAVIEVPWEDASRFGLMSVDDENRIVEFQEKPAEPESNLASMGIYIFTWSKLREALISDNADKESSHDFGKNIIPKFIDAGDDLYAYNFQGYWKDVGTIEALWDGNMDLINSPEELELIDASWRVNSRNPVRPAAVLGEDAVVKNSLFTDGCRIYGSVEHSVLSHSVVIEEGAVVKDSVIMPDTIVRSGAVLDKVIVGSNTEILANTKIGGASDPDHPYANKLCTNDISVVASNIVVKGDVTLPGGIMIEELEEISDEDKLIVGTRREEY